MLTSHDAFGYFGQEYGVTFLAPVGFSTEAEASASDVAGLIKQIKQEKVNAYFIENQTDPRLVKQIAAATGAKAGGELYPEALSRPGGPAATYEQAFAQCRRAAEQHEVISAPPAGGDGLQARSRHKKPR